MMMDMRAQTQIHWDKGYAKNRTHYLGATEQREYFKTLSETAEIQNIPDVLLAVFSNHVEAMIANPFNFRKHRYQIIDEKRFEKTTNCE